jgi:hypothetical protein
VLFIVRHGRHRRGIREGRDMSNTSVKRLMLAAPPARQTREQLAERIVALRVQLAEAEREHRRTGQHLAVYRGELNRLRAQLRNEPPTE